ncbi:MULTISPECIES: ABC transporter substrate-binding protein [unclassified Variovorax]|uniref:ABC transporter substrate-binding protein n=1 Tax=unclassified Variovorax TaxID=663243 RepID=UPI00076C8711|nr:MULTISPECIES: ABC transporter substrate-binding protein [unclassified Variovorax]KWT68515.1 ABC branched chain amino acid transporter, periplasmic ligand binding protein [Variovorax sp. WDL1]PNG46634.1 Leucine-, isoleucine-, valine-, threonine-, and alanine-binding protein [Variovorax sp. B2]PNG48715.1 Leucine-, isoleucine-, valine-, threonine-, and alanine-binding protein [Variovorax sp. B4]VTV14415.1 Leucine-, isoleucine-, valine-, threonine-, and alanine-binding protein precursor [Variovo
MTLKRRTLVQAAGAATLLGAAGTRFFPSAHAQGTPIRVGAMLPMSGIGAEAGAAWLNGIKAAQLQWNANGGLLGRQIEIVVRDDKFTSAGAVGAVRELAGEGVNLSIGAGQSPMALAIAPILAELKSVVVAPAPSVMSVTHENFSRNLFRLSSNALMLYGGIGNLMTSKFSDVETWAVIAPDSENGRDVARYFKHGAMGAAAKAGRKVQVLEPVFASLNKADYKIEINNLMNSGAQGLFIGLTAAPCVSLLQQGRAVGMDKKFKVIGEAGTELLIAKAMQKSTPQNLWGVTFWAPELEPFKSQFPVSKQLSEYILKVAGTPHVPGIVQASHRSALAIFHAVKKANSTETEPVIQALEGLQFDTAAGPYRIRKEDHQGVGSFYFAKIGARDTPPGYGLEQVVRLDETEIVEPPSPGRKYEG